MWKLWRCLMDGPIGIFFHALFALGLLNVKRMLAGDSSPMKAIDVDVRFAWTRSSA